MEQHAQDHAAASDKLARIEVCNACQGHRIEKVVYNTFMVLERTCSACDGEGVVTRTGPAPTMPAMPTTTTTRASRSLPQQQQQRRASIDHATQSA